MMCSSYDIKNTISVCSKSAVTPRDTSTIGWNRTKMLTINVKMYLSSFIWLLNILNTFSRIRREFFKLADEHDDVTKWKHFPLYWPLLRGILRSPVNSPNKGRPDRALMFSLICTWTNGWVNNRDAGDLRRRSAHYNVTVIDLAGLWVFFMEIERVTSQI